jgi:site-specific recombinase XerD
MTVTLRPRTKGRITELADLLGDWDTHLISKGRSKETRYSYLRCARALLTHLEKHLESTKVGDIDHRKLEGFQAALVLAGRAPATVAKHYRSLQQLFGWLYDEEEIATNPMDRMKPPAVPEQLVELLDIDQVRALIATASAKPGKALNGSDGPEFVARRLLAQLWCFIDTGARLDEIATLRLDEVHFDIGVLDVMGKGRRRRNAPFGPKTANALRRYLRVRAGHKCADLPALWLGERGPMTGSGIYQAINKLAVRAGIPVHPHLFRHYFADAWLDAGGGERALMEVAGWRSPAMVARYAKANAAKRARKAHHRMDLTRDL